MRDIHVPHLKTESVSAGVGRFNAVNPHLPPPIFGGGNTARCSDIGSVTRYGVPDVDENPVFPSMYSFLFELHSHSSLFLNTPHPEFSVLDSQFSPASHTPALDSSSPHSETPP